MKSDTLICVYLEKKFLVAFRCLMIFVALSFLWPIYTALNDGYVMTKGSKSIAGQPSFYLHLLKELLIASLFIWLGTGGAREKKADEDDKK